MTAADFASIGVTPEAILAVTLKGFSFVVGAYLMGYVIGVLTSAIRKV